MEKFEPKDFAISRLGPCKFQNPLRMQSMPFVSDTERILVSNESQVLSVYGEHLADVPGFEKAGPRERMFFDSRNVKCGIVTCGGLCPGINNVIRSLVLTLHYNYGVSEVWGFRYGYAGLARNPLAEPRRLNPEGLAHIHEQGGTILGSSRGSHPIEEMVETLKRMGIQILFVIGGDGTMRGAQAISQCLHQEGVPIAVIGIPKTIDNDIPWVTQSFGFQTAVEEADRVIRCAHVEALGAWNGVGVVKLMGRHSGFIAAHATLAGSYVNFCFIPEAPFRLEGNGGFLEQLEERLQKKRHAVVVVAEGAGQEFFQDVERQKDASGNIRFHDIGLFLTDRIRSYFAGGKIPVILRYLDPSYAIRSLPVNALDGQFCLVLGHHAVHAAMSGRTEMMVGHWNGCFTHVPFGLVCQKRKELNPEHPIWQRVLESTGQRVGRGTL